MQMSRIHREVARLYPAFAAARSSVDPTEESDLRLLADLASEVVGEFEKGRVEVVQPAFGMAEQLIATGTEAERDAAILGFLETVQNVASHRDCGSSALEIFLGPMSQQAWAQLTEVWKGKSSLAEVTAAETGASLEPRWWQFWKKRDRRSPRELLDQVESPELRKIIEQITRE